MKTLNFQNKSLLKAIFIFIFFSVQQSLFAQKNSVEEISNATQIQNSINNKATIEIGTGTDELDHPFYNYYKNARSQMLYYQADLGGAANFTALSFDISFASGSNELTDFVILIKETSLTDLGTSGFTDMTGATEVYSQALETLPGTMSEGWFQFIFDSGFAYSGTDNLIIEIYWGTNSSAAGWDDYYKVNSTSTWPDYTTVYGYHDTNTPDILAYNGSIQNSPNIRLETGVIIPTGDPIWTGTVSTEWNNINNWDNEIVPTCGGLAYTIPDVSGASNNFPYITVPAETNDLTIEAGAKVTIAPTGSLTVCGTFVNIPGTTGLFIKSDATGTGSLIHNDTGINATIEQYLPGGRYHYIGSPIIGLTDADIGIATTQFYKWDAAATWGGMGADPYGNPSTIDYIPWGTTYSGNIDKGVGYAYYHETQTIIYQGEINVSDYSISMAMANGGSSIDQGWSLVSNSFASAIDWDAVTGSGWDSNIESAVYMFDDDGTGSRGNYRYYIPAIPGTGGTYGVGSSDATRYIPSGQGFFVKTSKKNQNLDFDASADRVHNSQAFYKKEVHENLLRFTISNNQYKDETIIRLVKNATPNFDVMLDARKLIGNDVAKPHFYTIIDGVSKSTINSLPECTNDIIVPIGIIAEAGLLTIKSTEQTLVKERKVYLIDTYENKLIEMNAGHEYSFDYAGGIDNNRFEFRFTVNQVPYLANPLIDQNVNVNTDFTYTVGDNTFVDVDDDDILVLSAENMPNWLSFDNKTNTFSGTPTNTDIGERNVTVYATDIAGASTSDDFIISVFASSNINNFSTGITLQPNPSNGLFSIIVNDNYTSDYVITITDQLGRKIINANKSERKTEIDLSQYSAGIYFLNIQFNDNTTYTKKIIIDKK